MNNVIHDMNDKSKGKSRLRSEIQVLLFALLLSGLWACTPTAGTIKLRSGDLLFCEETSGDISEAIDQVTQTSAKTHFSHVGLVEVSDAGIFVLHASPAGGACQIPLSKFLHPDGAPVSVTAYRLIAQWQGAIPEALRRAHQMLGKPYNFSYIRSDTAHYCSEFIYLAFVHASVFKLEPMTFKDPHTHAFSPAWVDYYKKLKLEIPEGQPGCNPNGLAASDKLERLGRVH